MARLSPRPVRTFTIGFDEHGGFDERPYARTVAEAFGCDHTEFVVNPEMTDLIERLVWHHDQPFGDSSALPTFILSELTRRHVTVALSGDGGDEAFGGYERFAAAVALARLNALPAPVQSIVQATADRLPDDLLAGRGASIRRMLARRSDSPPDALLSWISYVPDQWRRRLLAAPSDWAIEQYHDIWGESDGAGLLNRLLLQNLRTYLLDDLLVKTDRMSMAHGLEVRSPFLDTQLLEFAFQLPPWHKIRGISLKRVLKAAVRDLIPHEILHRRKHGFGIPLGAWFRTDLRSYVEGMLCSNASHVARHLREEAVRALVGEHMAGAADNGHAIWTLLTLEVFLRREDW
jgi:asparagine synthase (glutamine-hydrolysing)